MIRCFKWFLNNVILSTPIVCIVLVIINIYIIHYSCTINSSTLDVGIIASVCCLTNSPSWPKFELRPFWNNIHDTFPPSGPRRIQRHSIVHHLAAMKSVIPSLPLYRLTSMSCCYHRLENIGKCLAEMCGGRKKAYFTAEFRESRSSNWEHTRRQHVYLVSLLCFIVRKAG